MVFDLLTPAPVATVELRWPVDDRARQIADTLAADPADDRGVEAWGRLVGASGRTLTRLFRAETGISVGRWRTRLRCRHRQSGSAGAMLIGGTRPTSPNCKTTMRNRAGAAEQLA